MISLCRLILAGKCSAVTADAGAMVSDTNGQNPARATISGGLAGDMLSFNGGYPDAFGDGGQINLKGGPAVLGWAAGARSTRSFLASLCRARSLLLLPITKPGPVEVRSNPFDFRRSGKCADPKPIEPCRVGILHG
jgi:hypothetical protein